MNFTANPYLNPGTNSTSFPLQKVFILENNSERLVSMMLWLDQFKEIEAAGSLAAEADVFEQVMDFQPDAIILDPSVLSLPGMPCIKQLRAMRTTPAVITFGLADANIDIDGQISADTSLKEIVEIIETAVGQRKGFAPVFMPMTKAS